MVTKSTAKQSAREINKGLKSKVDKAKVTRG